MAIVEWNDDVQQAYAQTAAKWQSQMQTMDWTDRHGRVWVALTKFKNRPFPVWTNQPRPAGWKPPHVELIPPSQYLEPRRGNRIQINYARWREDLRTAWKDRKAYSLRAAQDLYGRMAGEALKSNDPDVLEQVGTLPLDPVWVDAMEAGDLWALGVPKANGQPREVPDWAVPYIAKLPSVIKARLAEESRGTGRVQFVTTDDETMTPRAFVPQAYDEVMEVGADAPKKRGRPRKPAAPVVVDPQDDGLTDDEDDDE